MQSDREYRGYKIIGHTAGGLPIYQEINPKGGKWMKSIKLPKSKQDRPPEGKA